MTLLLEDFKTSKYSIDLNLSNTNSKKYLCLNNSNTKNIKPYSNLIIETSNLDIKSFLSKNGHSYPLHCNFSNNNSNQSLKLTFTNPIKTIIPNNYVWSKIIVLFNQTTPDPEYFPIMINLSQNIQGAISKVIKQKPYLNNNGLWCQEFNIRYLSINSNIIQNELSIEISNSNAPQIMYGFSIFKIVGETIYKPPLIFHPLTNIYTTNEIMHIKDAKVGDMICDYENKYVRITNIIKNHVNNYVNISKGSIDNVTPTEDLFLSPNQIININNKLTRAIDLVNHNTITLITYNNNDNNNDNMYGISINTTDDTFIKCNNLNIYSPSIRQNNPYIDSETIRSKL
jgi:hypothetical protein